MHTALTNLAFLLTRAWRLIVLLATHPKAAALVVPLLVLAVIVLCWRRGQRLPRHRSRTVRLRLHLRMRPGPGFATALELWLRWGRFASFRESGRARPSLTFWQRARRPHEHSLFLGRGHRGHALRLPVQEHAALIGPPRTGKSGLLSSLIMQAPGSVVSTSSKPDMFALTSGLRSRRGPVFVFNPMGLGGIPTNVRWNPLVGAGTPSVAIRRADAFANAVSTDGTEDGSFWATQASDHLRAMFAAGAIAAADMRLVGNWVLGTSAEDAVELLARAGFTEWAASLAQLDGPAEKTNATVKMVMRRALAYLGDPELVAATSPVDGQNFDIDMFLLSGGTLYMIAKGDGKDAALGPLFAALVSEIQFRATQLGSQMPGGRLDPPCLFALDEVTQICPVPLPRWLADSGGQGVQIVSAFHGISQLVERWRDSGAQQVMDTSGCKIIYPGLSDAQTLKDIAGLTGQHAFDSGGSERHEDVVTPEMIRRLPPGFALLVRGGHAPVVGKLARGWKHRAYKAARRAGTAVAAITAAPIAAAIPSPLTLSLDAELADAADVLAGVVAESAPWRTS